MYDATIAPDGKPFRLTHRHIRTGNLYRIVSMECFDFLRGTKTYAIANEHGVVFTLFADDFNEKNFEYIPGGQ